ncbi:PP2C family protein-serine/threonine phosphatase [Streptomyces rochei]|uniref:PP2C family protein-serine/threonine phosphatase n=1 Tax=Streptomyces TaxID=1883 RepID=UPI000A37E449|nr:MULTISPECIES: PP2C family protein-serine/threonine phosphatase [Streptomyces]MDI3097155.1 PP2C family protein-serine/threonine phosphatase [Streptomyces sp. AN-3]WDI19217.1 PP2C family protein-serine/threonine phosphatase [Streptomyces enissocaesilis]
MDGEGAHARAGGRLPGDPVPDPGLGDASEVPPAAAGRRGRNRYGRVLVRLLPVLLIVIAVLYDSFTPRYFTAGPLYTAAPLVAAAVYSRRGTVLTGITVVAVVVGLQLRKEVIHYVDSLTELITIATVAVLAVFVNAFVRRAGEQLVSVREIAEAAQRAVLPEPAERIGGFEIAACYEAAQADAFIGGDLYAVQDSPRGVRLVVGDVRGKGMGAVAAVAVVIGAFREAAEQEATLEAVAQRLERALAREGTRRDGLDAFEGFTTAVLAELPHGDGVVRILNRGHPPPLLLYADGTLHPLPARESALPLGMGELGVWPDRAEQAPFPAGATLLLYTDGLSEARDAEGEFYDPHERLAGHVFRHPADLLDALAEDVRRHSGGGMADDMALLAVRRP